MSNDAAREEIDARIGDALRMLIMPMIVALQAHGLSREDATNLVVSGMITGALGLFTANHKLDHAQVMLEGNRFVERLNAMALAQKERN